jgi:Na+/melibiose symporter-like transporter
VSAQLEERPSQFKIVDALLKLRRHAHYKQISLQGGRLSKKIRVSYGAPTLVHQTAAPTVIQLYALVFYEALGMTLATQAAIMAIARSLDVITDPSMSYITDNFQSKHGRRRPFIITGCWVYSIALVLLMTPGLGAELSPGLLNTWFACTYIFFFLSSTYCAIPYDALGPELTDNYDDRNELFMFSNLFSLAGTLVGAGTRTLWHSLVSTHSLTHSLTHSITQSLTHSLTHSFSPMHSPMHAPMLTLSQSSRHTLSKFLPQVYQSTTLGRISLSFPTWNCAS